MELTNEEYRILTKALKARLKLSQGVELDDEDILGVRREGPGIAALLDKVKAQAGEGPQFYRLGKYLIIGNGGSYEWQAIGESGEGLRVIAGPCWMREETLVLGPWEFDFDRKASYEKHLEAFDTLPPWDITTYFIVFPEMGEEKVRRCGTGEYVDEDLNKELTTRLGTRYRGKAGLEEADLEGRLRKVAEALPESDKARHIALMMIQGLSQNEMAVELDVTRPTIQYHQNKVYRALKRLQGEIPEEDGPQAEKKCQKRTEEVQI